MAAQGQGDAAYADRQANGQGFDGAPDVSTLADRFGELFEGQEQMRQILSALHEHLAPAQEEQGLLELDLDAVGLEHGGGDPGEQFDPHAQAQALDAFVSDRIQQAVAPLAQEMHDKWLPGEYRDLAAEFPEMGAARCLTLRARWPTRRAGHRRWPRAWG